jgi:hypothetical protein
MQEQTDVVVQGTLEKAHFRILHQGNLFLKVNNSLLLHRFFHLGLTQDFVQGLLDWTDTKLQYSFQLTFEFRYWC